MSDDDTIPDDLRDAIKALWQRDTLMFERTSEIFRRCYILETEVDALQVECHALRLRIRELEDKEKGPADPRPDF